MEFHQKYRGKMVIFEDITVNIEKDQGQKGKFTLLPPKEKGIRENTGEKEREERKEEREGEGKERRKRGRRKKRKKRKKKKKKKERGRRKEGGGRKRRTPACPGGPVGDVKEDTCGKRPASEQ
ncbi:unnamed protein product [Victoria cruziana]